VSNQSSVVVGGGVAGLAAAWHLARAGRHVTLLEARPVLGGRARSFTDRYHPGRQFDSCQHVAMGCCNQLIALFKQAGIAHLLKRQPSLHFITPDGKRSGFAASRLPAPAHLLWAFLGLHHLSLADKWSIGTAMANLARNPIPENQSFGDWLLRSVHQSPSAIANFWDLVIVSALNMPSSEVSPRLARKVFLDGFLASRSSFELILPLVTLEDLFHRHFGQRLVAAGVTIRTDTTVRAIQFKNCTPCAVECRDGSIINASEIAVTLPWDRVATLLADAPPHTRPEAARGTLLQRASISAVHLWYDRRVLATPHAALVGATAQWLFRHPQATPQDPYLHAVVSGSDNLNLDSESLASKVIADVARACPAARKARILHMRVVRERAATFQVPPGVATHRPQPGILCNGLAVAGDWTDTGWPATMEGACRSGFAAASSLLNRVRE